MKNYFGIDTAKRVVLLAFFLITQLSSATPYIEKIKKLSEKKQILVLEKRLRFDLERSLSKDLLNITTHYLSLGRIEERLNYLQKIKASESPILREKFLEDLVLVCSKVDCFRFARLLEKNMKSPEKVSLANEIVKNFSYNEAHFTIPHLSWIEQLVLEVFELPKVEKLSLVRFFIMHDQFSAAGSLLGKITNKKLKSEQRFKLYECLSQTKLKAVEKTKCFEKIKVSIARVLEVFYKFEAGGKKPVNYESTRALLSSSLQSKNTVESFLAGSVLMLSTKKIKSSLLQTFKERLSDLKDSKVLYLFAMTLKSIDPGQKALIKTSRDLFLKKFPKHPLLKSLIKADKQQALTLFSETGFFKSFLESL